MRVEDRLRHLQHTHTQYQGMLQQYLAELEIQIYKWYCRNEYSLNHKDIAEP